MLYPGSVVPLAMFLVFFGQHFDGLYFKTETGILGAGSSKVYEMEQKRMKFIFVASFLSAAPAQRAKY